MALFGTTRADRPTTTVTRPQLEAIVAANDAVVIAEDAHWSVDVGGVRFVAARVSA